ncbi:benzoate carboxyl methyltransferase-like protein [Tanacetum coccineum]
MYTFWILDQHRWLGGFEVLHSFFCSGENIHLVRLVGFFLFLRAKLDYVADLLASEAFIGHRVVEQKAMVLIKILHMNSGVGESSYANNSCMQETGILKALPVLKHTIKGIANNDVVFNQHFKIADLGCSSGKNTLLVVSNIIDILSEACKKSNRKPSQIQVCLNDLYGNDFNNHFKMLPDFYEMLKKRNGEYVSPCFVSAPGSFYDKLFLDQSLHLVYASYSVHWLSQVPRGLENNTSNIYMAKTSPPNVFQAYAKQFNTDFTKFLQLRSEELVCNGRMVLTLVGRSIVDPTSGDGCRHLELLAQSLLDMVKEDEIRNIIQYEGSFSLDSLNVFEVNWDPNDSDYTNLNDSNEPSLTHVKNAAKVERAYTELC